MIVNVSPTEDCKKETERTLEFGREVSPFLLYVNIITLEGKKILVPRNEFQPSLAQNILG